MTKKIKMDTTECIACWECVEISNEFFGMDKEDRRAFLINDENIPEELVDEAIESCPAECISWEEE